MISLRKISTETLVKARVLTHTQMSEIVGGGNQQCFLRCDQSSSEGIPVADCDRDTASSHCSSLGKAICTCSGDN